MEQLEVVSLARQTFYEELWTLTGQELRVRYALSPFSLQQLCERHRLPVPPLGYWPKVWCGKKVKRRPLPPLDDLVLQTVRLLRIWRKDAEPKLRHVPIVVDPALIEPHPLVAQAAKTVDDNGPCDAAGVIRGEPPNDLRVAVGRRSVDRALRLLDALVKAFVADGGEVFLGPGGLLWGRKPDGVGLALTAVAPTSNSPSVELLSLAITANKQVAIRNRWADTNSQRLDSSLRQIVNAIFESVARIRWYRLERECLQRQTDKIAELQRAQADAARDKSDAEIAARKLLAEAEQFHQASTIRRYLRAVRRRLASGRVDTASAAEVERWLERGMAYADVIDPLSKRLPARLTGAQPAATGIGTIDLSGELRMALADLDMSATDALYRLRPDHIQGVYRNKLWDEISRLRKICGYDVQVH